MLTPDISGLKQAVTTLTTTQRVLFPYADLFFRLPLGPQPLVVDGQKVGEFDPLQDYPQLAENLQNAQSHVFTYARSVVQVLHVWAIEGLPGFNDTFQTQAQVVTAVLDAVGANGSATPAQRQTVTGALAAIANGLAQGEAVIQSARQNLIIFQNQLTVDHDALTASDTALGTIIPQFQQQIADDAIKFIGMIGGQALAMLVEQIGGQEFDQLTSLAAVVGDVVVAGENLEIGLSAFANLVATLSAKYAAVITQVTQAETAQFASELQALDVQVAALAWSQLTDFVVQSGL